MSLPSPSEIKRFNEVVKTFNANSLPDYNSASKAIQRWVIAGAKFGAPMAVSSGIGQAAGIASGIAVFSAGAVSYTFAPIGAVIGPWIGALKVGCENKHLNSLYDALNEAKSGGFYSCSCGKCAKNIQYIIDKKEGNAIKIAIGVGTVGVSTIFTSMWSVGKSFQSNRPKEVNCKELIDSARNGCTIATATILLLSGDWKFLGGGTADTIVRAAAIILSTDGWKELKRRF